MHAVRKHILELLKEKERATVAELAGWLDMPAVSVRHHLDILQGDNLICVDRLERKGNVGRPQQVYALTEEAADYFPDNFAALAAGLVRQLKNVLPETEVEAAFRAMAADLANELDLDALDKLSTPERLVQVADFLTARGYLARWERTASSEAGEAANGEDAEDIAAADMAATDGFLLHKCNCPYADVAAEHPELCIMDQALINYLMGQPCVRTQSMTNDASCCTYRIGDSGDEQDGDEQDEDGHMHDNRVAGAAVGPQPIELRVPA